MLFLDRTKIIKYAKSLKRGAGTGHRAQGTGHRAQGEERHAASGTRHAARGERRREGETRGLRDEETARPQDRKTARPQDQKRPSRDGLFYRNYLIFIFFSGFGLASSFFGICILRMPFSYFASILSQSAELGSVNDLQNDW